MNLSKMKVGVRLGLGFVLVIFAGLVVAVVGRMQLARISTEVTSMINEDIVKVKLASQIKENLNLTAIGARNLVMITDRDAMKTEKQRIDEARVSNTELLKKLDQLVKSDKGRNIMSGINDARSPYNASTDKALALGMENRNEEARDVLLKETRVLEAAYIKALDELIELQQSLMEESAKDVQDMASMTGVLMLVIAIVAAVLGGLIALVLTRSITRQLGGEPDFAAHVANEIAAGNLTVDMPLRVGDDSSLLAVMKAMRDSLAQVVAQVRQGSESVATASEQIAQGNNDLSGRTEEQASALEQTAASMEELSSTVAQNADNARLANQLAQGASTVAVQGGEVVTQVVDTMRGINDSSRKIADIISVIDSIAFQTNILALNAAVEAARAGEQGRGFAVVATEVRSLAGRSAEAAKEIKLLINASVERVTQGSALVDQAGITMAEVVTSIRRVTDLMGEISAASSEQSAGVSQVGEAVAQMDQVTQQNAALVEESAAAADNLKTQAQQLVQAVSVFKLSHGNVKVVRVPEKAAERVVERRGPDRARNVARLPPRPPSVQMSRQLAPSQPVKTGTHDWESF